MEMNELNKASIELIINDQVALSIDSDVEIGKQQLQSFHPEAHYYSDPQFRLFKTDAGWNIEHDETAINETIVNGVKLTEPQLIAEGMVITVGNAAKGVLKLPIILKLSICPENTNNLKADREVVLAAVSNNGSALEYADDALKADRESVLAAILNEGSALYYADDTLKADREVVFAAVSKNGCALACADDTLKVDREVVLAAVSNDGSALEYADDTLKADREVVLAAVSDNGLALEYADDTLKVDRELVLAAVSNDGSALEYAGDTLKADREVVLAAISDNGLALEYADDTLKADREVVLAAVSDNGLALEYADDTLKADREVVLAAVSNNGCALEYLDDTSTSESENQFSNDITVRFPLTKGEGEVPDITQFSENELHDLRACLSMSICWEPEQMDENQEAKIMSIEILYDGITHIEDEDYGYWFEGDELYGYPAPVVRFHLDQDVDVEQFRTSIFTSSYKLTTESIEENDDEPFYAEDHNGYTSVLSEYERDELIEYFKSNDVFCGKAFNFPDGLSESGHSIPGEEFILENHGISQ